MKTTLKEAKMAVEILLNDGTIKNDNKAFGHCSPVYSSTNENCTGYMPKDFDLSNSRALCVTGSGDIPIEFALRKVQNIDCFDINSLAEFMAKLKIMSVLALDAGEFMAFYHDLGFTGDWKKIFDEDMYANKIAGLLDHETRDLWDHVYNIASNRESMFPTGVSIRSSNLFAKKNVSYQLLQKSGSYVEKEKYYKLKDILTKTKFNFMECSLFDLPTEKEVSNKKYSVIYLSNIAEYLKDMFDNNRLEEFKNFVLNKLSPLLDNNGLMIVAYLFDYLHNNGSNGYDIYDGNKRKMYLDYIFKMITFPSASHSVDKTMDAALIYTKSKI